MTVEEFIEELKQHMPKRGGGHGWGAVPRLMQTYTTEEDWPRMLMGCQNYALDCKRRGKVGTEFVMQAKTFFGRDKHWDEWADEDMRSEAEKAADRAKQALMLRAAKAGFRPQISGEPDYRYEEALKEAERALQPRAEPKFAVVR